MAAETGGAAQRGKSELAEHLIGVIDNLECALAAAGVDPSAALSGEVEALRRWSRERRRPTASHRTPPAPGSASQDRGAVRSDLARGALHARRRRCRARPCAGDAAEGAGLTRQDPARPGRGQQKPRWRRTPAARWVSSKDASADEIKKAMPTASLRARYHPGLQPGDEVEERFKEIQHAYDTLSDPEKEKQYDSGGCSRDSVAAALRRRGRWILLWISATSSTFFGSRGRAEPQSVRGADLETEVRLSFDQAVNGTQITVAVPKSERCATCGGSRAAPTAARWSAPAASEASTPRARASSRLRQPCPCAGGLADRASRGGDLRWLRPDPLIAGQGQHPGGVKDGDRSGFEADAARPGAR